MKIELSVIHDILAQSASSPQTETFLGGWIDLIEGAKNRLTTVGHYMVDKVSKTVRSRMMSAVKGKDTTPEKLVRSILFREGFRFRLHTTKLSGKPDIVLPRYRTIVFVHGCFWHGHGCRKGRDRPRIRVNFWNAKLDRNITRDAANQTELTTLGWKVFVVWACQIEADTSYVLTYLRNLRNQMR